MVQQYETSHDLTNSSLYIAANLGAAFIQPAHSPVVLPNTLSFVPVEGNDLAFAVAFAVGPLAQISASICPGVLPIAVFFVELVLATVFSAVFP